jgi:hypothetical protein
MTSLAKFIAYLGWPFLCIERLLGDVPTHMPMWFWWGSAAAWVIIALIALTDRGRA